MRRRDFGTLSEPVRYLEQRAPIVFPEEERLPETQPHCDLRTLLYQLFLDHAGSDVTVGSDQFVYFDADNPKRCVAPDVYVRLAPRGEPIRSWKTWERGAPEIAVEIISDDDRSPQDWNDKLERYGHMGVSELVRFDSDAAPERKLRVWNRVQGALVERIVSQSRAPSLIFELYWVLAPADEHPLALRLATGSDGEQLLSTRLEARQAEAQARQVAEARIRELEAALAARDSPEL